MKCINCGGYFSETKRHYNKKKYCSEKCGWVYRDKIKPKKKNTEKNTESWKSIEIRLKKNNSKGWLYARYI